MDESRENKDDIDELLDSALQDFDKRKPKQPKAKPDQAQKSTEDDLLDIFNKAGFPQGASMRDINDQLLNLSLMNQNPSFTSLSKAPFSSSTGAEDTSRSSSLGAGVSSVPGAGASSLPGADGSLEEALLKLSQDSAKLNVLPTDEEMERMFQGMSTDNLEKDLGNLLPMMNGMMQSLLSKDLLYPAMKDMNDEYPAWLTKNKAALKEEEYIKYQQQYQITKKICTEFEKEIDSSQEAKTESFDKILALMEEMQKLGNPPQDLVGSSAFPTLPNMTGQEQCTIS